MGFFFRSYVCVGTRGRLSPLLSSPPSTIPCNFGGGGGGGSDRKQKNIARVSKQTDNTSGFPTNFVGGGDFAKTVRKRCTQQYRVYRRRVSIVSQRFLNPRATDVGGDRRPRTTCALHGPPSTRPPPVQRFRYSSRENKKKKKNARLLRHRIQPRLVFPIS